MSDKKRSVQTTCGVRLFRIVGIEQRSIRIGLSADRKSNLAGLNDSYFQIGDWTWDGARGVCLVDRARIADNKAGVPIGFSFEPD